MHTIRFRIKTLPGQNCELEKRFRAVWHIHNEMVSYAQRCLNLLFRDRQYLDARQAYADASRRLKKMDGKHGGKAFREREKELTAQKRAAANALNERTSACGISKVQFDRYVSVMQKAFRHLVSSQQAQKEAERVLAGVEKVLYGNGKRVHMKRLADQHTVSQKCATNGVKVNLSAGTATWGNLVLKLDIDFGDPYVKESISSDLCYAEISRLPFRNGYHYYVTLILKGPAPEKLSVKNSGGVTGIDPGVSTIAAVSGGSVLLEELAPMAKQYDRKIAKQQRLVDADLRRDNPENYNPDGTVKRGRRRWKLSKGCRRRKQEIRVLQRKKAAAVRDSHNRLANRLITENGPLFITEEMDYRALKKRSKAKPERRLIPSVIRKKDGTEQTVYKYKKKRRFGLSVGSRAPASLLSILARKAQQYGGQLVTVNTRLFRASQYHHDTGEYIRTALSDRWKIISGHRVQRDLYSAFLILCSDPSGTSPDRDMCTSLFPGFCNLHDKFVTETKSTPHPACFGY